MKKRTKVLLAFGALILCSALFVGATSRCNYWHLAKRLYGEKVRGHYVPTMQIRFDEFMAAGGVTRNGAKWDGHRYKSSDCIEIRRDLETYGSPEEAKREMEQKLKFLGRVQERGQTPDRTNPSLLLERALIINEAEGRTVILRRKENRLVAIMSNSLQHALEFERRLN